MPFPCKAAEKDVAQMLRFRVVSVTVGDSKVFREVGEEVVTEYPRDACQQCGIDTVAAYDAVHDGAVAVKIPCEPADAALLTVEFIFDALSDAYHVLSVMPRPAACGCPAGRGMRRCWVFK